MSEANHMSQNNGTMSLSEIKSHILRLPAADLFDLFETVEKRAETLSMMKTAETGFREWNAAGEDIYDVGA